MRESVPTGHEVIVPSKTDTSIVAITMKEYSGWQDAFDFLNTTLFGGTLPNVAITLESRAHSSGYFAPDRFTYRVGSGGHEHKLSLNPDAFKGRTDEWIVSVLLHEMCHLWQHHFGTTKRRRNYAYHDKEWAGMMMSLGLMPSNTGAVGGRITGQRMSHYVLDGGAYQLAFTRLAARGWELRLESSPHIGAERKPPSKVKFSCPCGQNAWGKPVLAIRCDLCNARMTAPPDAQLLSEAAE